MMQLEVSGATRETLIALSEGLVEDDKKEKAKKMIENMTNTELVGLVENAIVTATEPFNMEIDERLTNMFKELK